MDLHRHLNGEIEYRSLRLNGKFIWIAVIAGIGVSRTERCFMMLQSVFVLSLDLGESKAHVRIPVQAFGIRFNMGLLMRLLYAFEARCLTSFIFSLYYKDVERHPHRNTTRWNTDFVPVGCLGTASAARWVL